MNRQTEFSFDASKKTPPHTPAKRSGYEVFRAEREAALKALEERFGVILNRRVRVRVAGLDDEFVGILVPDQLLLPVNRKEGLRLRIGSAAFDWTDIETCVLEPDSEYRRSAHRARARPKA